jgi:hypothetical protein
MGEANIKRSQAILRMPVDMVDAVMILHDGDRSDVLLFVPPTEDVARVMSSGAPFLPVMREASMCLVAREAIACLGVAVARAPKLEEDFPAEEQKVKVTLKSGTVVEGIMKWVPSATGRRTGDHLNSDCTQVVLYAGEQAWIIAKSHIAMLREA